MKFESITWHKGFPKVPSDLSNVSKYSIYWLWVYDHATIIQFCNKTGHIWFQGEYGGGELKNFYNKKSDNLLHSEIEKPKEWLDISCIKKKNIKAWIKHQKGYIGFGILRPDYNNTVSGNIVWLDHPTDASGSGIVFNSSYRFCPVEIPNDIKKLIKDN